MRVSLTWLALAGVMAAAGINLAWTPNPTAENITFYEVTAKTPNTELALENLKPGVPYFFSLRAENAAGVSDFSPVITGIPLPRYKVTIQKSASLGVWSDTTTVLTGTANGAEFFRLKIELDDYQGVEP
jgi:hypothetical protein